MYVPKFCFVYLFFYAAKNLCCSSLEWEIELDFIGFGEDVILNCDVSSCSTKRTQKWIGGHGYQLLSIGNYSTNTPKYEITNSNRMNYRLKIKNLSLCDFNRTYTCSCGLQQSSKLLDLDGEKYIFPPQVQIKRLDDDLLDIYMFVYPPPKCFLNYKVKAKPKYNTVLLNASYFKMKGPYIGRIYHSLKGVKNLDCNLQVYCELGSHKYRISDDKTEKCIVKFNNEVYYENGRRDERNKLKDIMIKLGGILAITFISYFSYTLYSNCKDRRNKHIAFNAKRD